MTVTYANSWDAGRILARMSDEEKERLREQIAVRKLAHEIVERPYNKRLLSFVERRLNGGAHETDTL